jgi:hypothetical protein
MLSFSAVSDTPARRRAAIASYQAEATDWWKTGIRVFTSNGAEATEEVTLAATFTPEGHLELGAADGGRVFARGNILGTVGQSAGVPTGAVVACGSNANGEYVRLADGTQICARTDLSAANASTALGSLYRSAMVTWTFPIAFAAAPTVTGGADDADAWLSTAGAPGTGSCGLRVIAAVSKGAALNFRAMAVGRWF